MPKRKLNDERRLRSVTRTALIYYLSAAFVPDIDPSHPYAVFLQNTLILEDVVLRAPLCESIRKTGPRSEGTPQRSSHRTSFESGFNTPDPNQCDRVRVLKEVACGPGVETGASVPGYSGGFAACAAVSDSDLL
jgi:hypothetical protein